MRLIERIPVPEDLEAITSRSPLEVEPRSLGIDAEAIEGIWQSATRLYASRMHPALQLSVRRHGELVLDRAIGHASGNGPDDGPGTPKVALTHETPINIFSASKAVSAMVIHLLDQKHLLHINDLVAEYIPEFARHGKEKVTIEHVLTHRAGIPNLPQEHVNLDLLADPERIVDILCDSEPTWAPGRRLAYHAITGGFILAEIVRRVTGKDIREVLHDEILGPLGYRWMNYGVRPEDMSKVATNYITGPMSVPPVDWFVRRVLGVGMREAAEMSNDPRFLSAIIPSANICTTANELCRFYDLLLTGEQDGLRIFEPRTIRRATSEQSYLELDLMLGVPLRYSMGFMLGGMGLYGPDTHAAFGHVGLLNIFGWADPERQVSVALTNTGKPLLYPELYFIWDIMSRIASTFPKEGPRARRTHEQSKSAAASRTRAGSVVRATQRVRTGRSKGPVSRRH